MITGVGHNNAWTRPIGGETPLLGNGLLVVLPIDLRVFNDLLNTGVKPLGKVRPPGSFEPGLSLRLVQWSFAKRYLMKAILGFAWAVAVPLGDDIAMHA